MKTKTLQASQQLDALDDQIVARIAEIELGLRNYFSVRVWTPFNDETQLVFGKHRGAWALLISRNRGRETQPLASASRNIRQKVLSGGHIERLIREGALQIGAQIAEREHALREAERIITAFREADQQIAEREHALREATITAFREADQQTKEKP